MDENGADLAREAQRNNAILRAQLRDARNDVVQWRKLLGRTRNSSTWTKCPSVSLFCNRSQKLVELALSLTVGKSIGKRM